MAYFTQLFPPVIPPNLPAYDGTKVTRIYFQVSVANSRDQFKHAQVIVNRLDSNRNALNTATYPFGMIFLKNDKIVYDSSLKMYYFELPANTLPLDVVYKLQVRVGAQDLNTVSNLNYMWLNNPSEYSQFSEWSTVCLIKPITIPVFDLVGFRSKNEDGTYVQPSYVTDNVVNVANTPGFLFTGSYSAADPRREETIQSYKMTLYEDNGTTIEPSWRELSKSGVKYIGQYEASNIQHSFDYVLERPKTYYVKYEVTSKNGYVGTKIYKVLVMYADVNLYNTFHITPDQDLAKISLHVQGKQLLLKADTATGVEPTKDAVVPESILYTHMLIQGTVKESENLDFHAISGQWVIQMRAMGINPLATKPLALKNPVFTIVEDAPATGGLYHKIKLCAVKCKISFDREPTPRYMNDFILVKEVWRKNTLIFRQERYTSFPQSDLIDPMKEYYFYIKEDNGYMDFSVEKVRTSTNSEIATAVGNYKINS